MEDILIDQLSTLLRMELYELETNNLINPSKLDYIVLISQTDCYRKRYNPFWKNNFYQSNFNFYNYYNNFKYNNYKC